MIMIPGPSIVEEKTVDTENEVILAQVALGLPDHLGLSTWFDFLLQHKVVLLLLEG